MSGRNYEVRIPVRLQDERQIDVANPLEGVQLTDSNSRGSVERVFSENLLDDDESTEASEHASDGS